jgi:LPS export ABC transporter protein LptC
MSQKYRGTIDRLINAYANSVWKEEKRKYREKTNFQLIVEMIRDRLAIVYWIFFLIVMTYVTYIYVQDTVMSRPLRAIYMDQVYMQEKEHGNVVSTMKAEKVVRDETNSRMHFIQVKYTSFKEKNRVDMIRSRKALHYTQSKNMHFEGRVFLRSERAVMDGDKPVLPQQFTIDRFYSERLDYFSRRRILTTNQPVTMLRGRNVVVTGDTMKTHMKEERTEIVGNVKITVYDKEEQI